MRIVTLYLLRLIWLLLVFCWIWSLAGGGAVQPLHPYNLLMTVAVAAGAVAIWFPQRAARILAYACGIITALMMSFQFLGVLTMFSGGQSPGVIASFGANVGPFRFEGMAAVAALFLPPLLLFVFSIALLAKDAGKKPAPVPVDEKTGKDEAKNLNNK